MKLKNIFLFVFGILSSVYCQKHSALENYYPLQVGNSWLYIATTTDETAGTTEYASFELAVVGDTLLPNGQRYMKLFMDYIQDEEKNGYIFERIDSSATVYRYGTCPPLGDGSEFKIDSLGLTIGQSFQGCYREWNAGNTDLLPATNTLIETQIDTLFRNEHMTRHYSSNNHLLHPDTYHYWLAENIGLVHAQKDEPFWHYQLELMLAFVNGVDYVNYDAVSDHTQPQSLQLLQNYPNPFNATTTIVYNLKQSGKIELSIFDTSGKKVATLVDEFQQAGMYRIRYEPSALPSGMYICRIKRGDQIQRCKISLLK